MWTALLTSKVYLKVPYASLTAEEREFLKRAHLDVEGEDDQDSFVEDLGQELTFDGKTYIIY